MSQVLTSIEDLAANYSDITVTLSGDNVAVIFYALSFLFERSNWLSSDPLDEISDSDWDTIEALVASCFEVLE